MIANKLKCQVFSEELSLCDASIHSFRFNNIVQVWTCACWHVYLLSSAVSRVAQELAVCPCMCDTSTLNAYGVNADRPST